MQDATTSNGLDVPANSNLPVSSSAPGASSLAALPNVRSKSNASPIPVIDTMASDVSDTGFSFRDMYVHQRSAEASVSRLPPHRKSNMSFAHSYSSKPATSSGSSTGAAAPAAPVASAKENMSTVENASRPPSASSPSPQHLSAANLNAHNANFVPQTAFNAPQSVDMSAADGTPKANSFSTFPRSMVQRKPGIPPKQMTIQIEGASNGVAGRGTGAASATGRVERGESVENFQDNWPPALYTEDSDHEDDGVQSLATDVYASITGYGDTEPSTLTVPGQPAVYEASRSTSYYN